MLAFELLQLEAEVRDDHVLVVGLGDGVIELLAQRHVRDVRLELTKF